MASSVSLSALSLTAPCFHNTQFQAGKPQIRCSVSPVTTLASAATVQTDLSSSTSFSRKRFLGESCISASFDSAAPASEAASDETPSLPTPTLPSGTMMAEFLLAYRRMLQFELVTGDSAAAAGADVLERIRVGLSGLLGHPQHGAQAGSEWMRDEERLEECLRELEKDMSMIHQYHKQPPTRLAVAFTSGHCVDAARLLRQL